MLEDFVSMLTNWFWIGLVSTLLCGLVISPVLASLFVEGYNSLGTKKADFNTRLGSTVHAVIGAVTGLYLMLDPTIYIDKVNSHSLFGEHMLEMSTGYFIADYVLILLDPEMRKVVGNHIHHLVSLTGTALSRYYRLMVFFVTYRYINEFSTPIVNLFTVQITLKKNKGPLFVFTSTSMVIVFFLCRIVLIPLHWKWIYEVYRYAKIPSYGVSSRILVWYIFLVYPTFDLLNLFWLRKMVLGYVKMIKGNKIN